MFATDPHRKVIVGNATAKKTHTENLSSQCMLMLIEELKLKSFFALK
jgi:hypothetical protein